MPTVTLCVIPGETHSCGSGRSSSGRNIAHLFHKVEATVIARLNQGLLELVSGCHVPGAGSTSAVMMATGTRTKRDGRVRDWAKPLADLPSPVSYPAHHLSMGAQRIRAPPGTR